MQFRLNWWKSARLRHSQTQIRSSNLEQLEERVLLSASPGLSFGPLLAVSELGSSKANECPDDHADHDADNHKDSGIIGSYYLPPQHRLTGAGALLSGPAAGAPLDLAIDFLNNHVDQLGLQADDLSHFVVVSEYTDARSGTSHLYLRQTLNQLEVVDADISISITANGEVISVTSSFVSRPQAVTSSRTQVMVNASEALMGWSDGLQLGLSSLPQVIRTDIGSVDVATLLSVEGSTIEDVAARLVYVPTPNGLELAWQFDVHNSDYSHWLNAFVSAGTGEALYTNNRIGNATYNVFALPARSPIDGIRSVVVDPQDATASPFGWHDTNGAPGAEFTDTRGNNATVQEDVNADDLGGFRPSGGAGLVFNFPLDTTQDPFNFQSAAITNAFYWANLLHDIHYQYGFTEAAGNFQVNNYGRGGLGNDPVLIDIQDGASSGGGAFATLPDGQSPRMTLPRLTGPFRDGALDNDVLIHEFGHGITERLTGGPGNTSALNAVQSRAMGEGWGDWWAVMLTQVAADQKTDAYPIGNYSAGFAANGPGVRAYPYSFDMTINPLTYNNFNGGAANNASHKAGPIWASALWDMNWLLIDKFGFSSDMLHGSGGNNLALQLVMDGLKLQGTNPSFLAGRDAILAADVALTGGQNQTEIWSAFARRGMGFSASDGGSATSTTVVAAFDVPGSIGGTVFRDDDANGAQNGAEPGLSGWTVFLDQNNNGILDVATITTYNSVDTPKTIIDQGTTYSNRVVSGLSGVIVDINVTINLTHPADGELYLTLISPGNTPVILANYLGGSGANYTNTTFDDEATTYISAGAAPFTGSFKPYFNLSQLDGRDPNGTWKLRMDDAVAGNVGTLLSWSLQITFGNADRSAVTDANGNYTFYGLGSGAYTVREIVQPGFTQTSPVGGVQNVVLSGNQAVGGRNFGDRAAATVANVTTLEETISSAMVINPTIGQGITHFKISGISGGILFKNNGVTQIQNGDFITVAEGQSGVRFLPSANSNAAGHIDVELSQNGSTVLAQTSKSTNTITVTPVGDTPQVANIGTLEDTLSGAIIISRFPGDGNEVTHFRISGISGGTLFKNNGVTQIANGSFITFAESQAGVKFLPALNITLDGHFDVESSQNGTTVATQSGKVTSTITVTSVGDTPQVANVTALEDMLSGPIVVSRFPDDDEEVTHFRISGISGGSLFKNDGVTQIVNGAYITFAEGQAGLRFLPSANSNADGHFDVESSQNGTTVASQSGKATCTITVTPVGDTPQVAIITTLKNTLSGAIVISRNASDGSEVTHFRISAISGGSLFKNDGVTQIVNGAYITSAEGQAGVRFLPSANSTSDGHFDVESSQNGTTVATQSGKATSTITVTPVGGTPQVANITTLEDSLSGAIIISRNANDGSEVTHFRISGISGGSLFKSDGVTPISYGTYITFAEAQAGVRFLPSANSNADGHFDVESSQDGTTVATQSGKATSTITVTAVGDTPQVANITTLEDSLSGAIVISRNANDGIEVTHFRISAISGGSLFKSDGVTQIVNGTYITFAEGQAGVRFLPSANSNADGHFDVESSQNGTTVAAQSGKATSTITVTPVGDTPQVANITTLEDSLSGAIVISRNANDGSEVTHFRISGISGGSLFKSDGVTQIVNGAYITFVEGQAGVRFLPSANSSSDGHFDVESSQNGTTVATQSGKATSTITVTPVGDTPQVANITTLEDSLSGTIVISRNASDGSEVTHFGISGISGGSLFKSDGVTPISNGAYITFAEGQAGVRFLPSANSTSDGRFDVESSQNGTTVAAQSGKATSTITVTPVGDTPQVANIPTLEDTLSGAIVISRNANDGIEVTHFRISGISGGTVFKSDGITQIVNGTFITFAEAQAGVRFLPASNSTSDGHFDVESSQNGTTVAAQSGKATSTISVTPVGDTPQVANVTTLEDSLSGAIVISRNANDGNEVTHFRISGISGGTVFKNDGVTQIVNGSFITAAEAQAGVRFLPASNSTSDGHFDVESSQNGTTVAAQSGKATSMITVTPVGDTPQVANIATLEDTLSGTIVISRNANDGIEVTHFRISGISGGTVFKSDGITQIVNGTFITFAEAQAGVRFLPAPNSTSNGHFDVESSQNGTTVAAQSGKAASTITVTPLLSITDVDVIEGDNGQTLANFTIMLSRPCGQTVTVDFSTSDNTAQDSADYNAISGTLSFAPGETAKTISVPILDDFLDETNESFVVNLSNATNSGIAKAQGIGTIVDDDSAIFMINDVAGNESAGMLGFILTTNSPLDVDVVIDVSFPSGSATGGVDYVDVIQHITFLAGQTSQQVTVTVNDDNLVEMTEFFMLSLTSTSPLGGRVLDLSDTGIGRIIENDLPVITSLSVASVAETTPLTTVVLDVNVDQSLVTPDVVLNYSLTGSDAAAFQINSATGEITFNSVADSESPLDQDGDNVYHVTVLVSVDFANPPDAQSIAQDLTITVTPMNEMAPVFANPTPIFSLPENSVIGTVVGSVSATDGDLPTPLLTYSIISGNANNAFTIDAATGLVSVANPTPLDYESTKAISFTAQVSDNGPTPLTSTVLVVVNLKNVIEGPIIFIPSTPVSIPLKRTSAITAPDSTFTYQDVANPDFDGARLTVSIVKGRSKKDALLLLPTSDALGQVFIKGHKLFVGATPIGIFSGGKGSKPNLVVILNGNATKTAVGNLLQRLSMKPKDFVGIDRTIQVQLTNISGVNSNIATRVIPVES